MLARRRRSYNFMLLLTASELAWSNSILYSRGLPSGIAKLLVILNAHLISVLFVLITLKLGSVW